MKRIWFGLCVLILTACYKEKRVSDVSAPMGATANRIRLDILEPGGHSPEAKMQNPYEGNYQAVREGKRLFSWYNCAGCHSPGGGGGMGPPLIDDHWIYGSQPGQIHQTIAQGRPNGMPAFGSKISEHEMWQLVSYVQSLPTEAAKKTGQ
jgi:cytochrome c oxidase cbb3-type subunit 3